MYVLSLNLSSAHVLTFCIVDWTLHPASDFKNGVPSILSRYDISLNPLGLQRVYQNLRYFNTGIGHLIREMNSTIGIPYAAFRIILADNIICEGCQCMYSVDGFNAHIERGKCSNTPDLISGTFVTISLLLN